MNGSLEKSYRYCQQQSRGSASSFYWSFRLLPVVKRKAMCALYAYSRHTDDLGDSDEPSESRRQALTDWRSSLERALAGQCDGLLWPALVDATTRYRIPHEYLFAILDGVAMDIDPCRYESFDDLRRYCYHVASAVGLACIHIWGFHDRRACALAEECGVALQMTNILRDLEEDAKQGRVYLPQQDLQRFGYSEQELKRGVVDARFRKLMRFEIDRTEQLFFKAEPILQYLHVDGRRACAAMLATYRGLLGEIRRRDGDVFGRKVRLPKWRKLALFVAALANRGESR